MSLRELQAEIDQHPWYHEFDFGQGLRAKSATEDVRPHRRLWRFIQRHLDAIDFRDKTVLDIGCWDGYWSFHAERRGAKQVLAADDLSQNWSDGGGLRLAHRLLGSRAEVNQDLSVYQLSSLGRTFDVVLCLGVYYHLLDPLFAFAQVRHCCHAGTVVLFEGDVALSLRPGETLYNFTDPAKPAFLPSAAALNTFLQASYLRVTAQRWMYHPWSPRAIAARLRRGRRASGRVLTVCAPFEGVNETHCYRPPFGLHRYDERFRAAAAA